MADKAPVETIIIRTWPKLIFMWPTAVLSLVLGLLMLFSEGWENVYGAAFLICMALNLIVLTFDFPRSTSLTVFIAVVVVVLGLILLNQQFAVIAPLKHWLGSLKLNASRDFYLTIAVLMGSLFAAMAFVTRFDYWELTSNELIHRTGLLGDVERFSTAGLKLNTEIRDVFEYCLAGAGRVIMNIPASPRPIVLDNVLGIKTLMETSKDLLSRRVVQVSQGKHAHRESDHQREATAEDEQ